MNIVLVAFLLILSGMPAFSASLYNPSTGTGGGGGGLTPAQEAVLDAALTNVPTLQAVVNAGNTATGIGDIQISGRIRHGTGMNAADIAADAHGAQQAGLNGAGTMTIGSGADGAQQAGRNIGIMRIGDGSIGAQQRGIVAPGAYATNDAIGAVQLLNLAPGQSATITSAGDTSIGLGACVVSNKQSIVAGDGQVSHGDGSVTAGGGFHWGDNPVLTNAWQNPASASYWTWTSDGTNITLTGYTGPAAVFIPYMLDGLPVTVLGQTLRASTVTNVSGGANIKTISGFAFESCIALKSVSLPNATTIGSNAFEFCETMTSVSLPNATTIGNYAFAGCEALPYVSLPNVTTVGNFALGWCSSLTSVYLSQNAPTPASNVYSSSPNATNYVTNPTATGWGATWNGRPVVRLSVYSDSFVGNGAGITNITAVTYAAAPLCSQITLTNASALSWTNTWLPTSKVSRVTLTSTGTVTFVWNWPTQQDAGMRFALDRTGMPAVVFPAGAIYLTNGIYGTSAPVLGKSNYVSVIHDCNTYQIMVIPNTIGTWGTP